MQEHREQELAPIGALKFAEYNPRDISEAELAKLKASLREFGFIQPVVARREDGLVIGGHQRLTAYSALLRDEGVEDVEESTVPVVYLDGVDDNRAKILNLALNKISGEWDYDKLSTLLSDLRTELEGVDDLPALDLTGFSTTEIAEIVNIDELLGDGVRGGGDGGSGDGVDIDEALEQQARRFVFKVPTRKDADLVREALKAFGQTGLNDAGEAFMRMVRVALVHAPDEE